LIFRLLTGEYVEDLGRMDEPDVRIRIVRDETMPVVAFL
jgi:hypothetical protein